MKKYKILSADIKNGTFIIQFDGLQPLNFWIPHNETGFLTGQELDDAIQLMYPMEVVQTNKFASFVNGAEIEALVTKIPTLPPTSEQIRQQRDILLLKTDWTQLPDAPLTTEQKTAWAVYRQELRDITKQAGFPNEINFPIAQI